MSYTTVQRPSDEGNLTTLDDGQDLVLLDDTLTAIQLLAGEDNYSSVTKPGNLSYTNLVTIGYDLLQEDGFALLQEDGTEIYWTESGVSDETGYSTVTRPSNE